MTRPSAARLLCPVAFPFCINPPIIEKITWAFYFGTGNSLLCGFKQKVMEPPKERPLVYHGPKGKPGRPIENVPPFFEQLTSFPVMPQPGTSQQAQR
jgi:hypothetical protein